MPDVFHPKIFEAVAKAHPKILLRLKPEHFASYTGINEALDWLPPQDRCNAVYADWLESLNLSVGGTLLRVRKLLIEQGGLAANYFAEFAQNADDAFEGDTGGEVRIWTRPGWLFVANNGRRINGTDLLGLCRFFANGSKIESTNDDLIGKFGIGFKSCYRIGTEVWVHTWELKVEQFSFRIPLCHSARPQSHYNEETFKRVLGYLDRKDSRSSQDELGFCTPEFHAAWPMEIGAEAASVQAGAPKQGTVFAIRLHEEGAAVLKDRLQDQRNQVFELCPLFVRRLRVTKLEDTALTLIEHRQEQPNELPGVVAAARVTLEAQTGEGEKSNARFWRLTSTEGSRPWKLALHADSKFQLSIRKESGETTSLREGAAYAFFPLTIPWPFKLHLHLDQPTNLDRSNWNPEQPEAVRHGLEAAAEGLAKWLEASQPLWHENWSLAALVENVPAKPPGGQSLGLPAYWFFNALKIQIQERKLLRTVWGDFTSGRGARAVHVRDDPLFFEAWKKLGNFMPTLRESHPWCFGEECAPWGIEEINPDEIIAAAEKWRSKVAITGRQEFSRHLLVALLGLAKAVRKDWERIFGLVQMDDQGTTFAQLCARPGGATLTPEWHGLFAQLAGRTRHEAWVDVVVGKESLHGHFSRFVKPAFNPAWSDAPSVLHAGLPPGKWDEFYNADKEPCPTEFVGPVLAALHVRDARDEIKPVLGVWLFGRAVPEAFKALFLQVNPPRQLEYKARLQKWGLWEDYLVHMETVARASLPVVVIAGLRLAMEQENIRTWLEYFEYQQNELAGIGAGWKQLHEQGVVAALESAFATALLPAKGKSVLSRSIDTDLREVLVWSTDFIAGPAWLDDSVVQKLNDLRLAHLLSEVTLVKKRDLPSRTAELVRSLLEIAHVWTNHRPTPAHYAAINRLAAEIPKTERRNLLVGLGPRKRKPLEDFLLIEDATDDPNLHWLRQTRDFSEKLLPNWVGRVPAFSEVCPRAGDLKLKAPALPENALAFPVSSIVPELAALAVVRTLLDSGKVLEVHHHHPIELEWWENERCVAEVKNAEFYFEKVSGRLFVSRLVASLDDHQIEIVLGNYLQYSAQDREVDEAWKEAKSHHTPLAQVYTRFRERIKRTLAEALVKKMGYETAYIWREMLQNAENAYASMPDPRPEDRVFEVDVEESEKLWQVRVNNHGRRFNQKDREGNERRDIDRIISVGGDRVQIAEEIGRYNLGFKSVFSSTDTVEIISGGFEFRVQDLLLRYPSNPTEDVTKQARPTSFSWRCTRHDGAKIVGLAFNAHRNTHSSYLRASYALFGRSVNRLVLKFRGSTTELRIDRALQADVERVTITLPTGTTEHFSVLRGRCILGVQQTEHTFSCAIRLGAEGMPEPIPEMDRHFHLVYPTEEKAFTSYLVDADFEPVGVDRRQLLKSKRNLSLILSAARMVFEHAMKDLANRFSRERWLAWAEVLNPKGLAEGVQANYDEGASEGDRLAVDFKTELLKRVPHHGRPVAGTELTVPTRLLRKFAAKYGEAFGLNQDDWIDEKVEKKAEQLGLVPDYRLNEWVSGLPQNEDLLGRVGDALHDFSEFTQIERPEMQLARDSISRRLEPAEPIMSDWDLARIVGWWKNNLDAEPYILEGHLFPWVCVAPDPSRIKDPRKYLRDHLTDTASPEGKAIWYRMFTFACLVSAGHRTTEMQGFLAELKRHRFFTLTADPDANFADVTAPVFDALVQREHQDQWASGEAAHFWRRIFYDARKVHHLIYRNDFAEVFLELARRESFGETLPDFLRSGTIPGQRPWRGVIGQSAAAPLLFIVRELRRLQIIEHAAVDPVAFFTCKPVRRVAVRLGWIDPVLEDAVSWSDLLKVSRIIHAKFTASDEARAALLPYYDIPLLALDQSNEMI